MKPLGSRFQREWIDCKCFWSDLRSVLTCMLVSLSWIPEGRRGWRGISSSHQGRKLVFRITLECPWRRGGVHSDGWGPLEFYFWYTCVKYFRKIYSETVWVTVAWENTSLGSLEELVQGGRASWILYISGRQELQEGRNSMCGWSTWLSRKGGMSWTKVGGFRNSLLFSF